MEIELYTGSCRRDSQTAVGGKILGGDGQENLMRILLNTNFVVLNSESREINLPSTIMTVRDLIEYAGRQVNFQFFKNGSGELETDLGIVLNGKEVWFYPDKLDTRLKDGDSVVLYLMPLGGG